VPGSPSIAIRAATQSDEASLGRLGAMLVRSHHDYDPRRFIAATSGTEEGYGSFLGTQLDEPDKILLVAESGGHVIGYAYAGLEGMDWMSLRGPAGVLHDLVVDPAYRKHGVGRLLLDTILTSLKNMGARQFVLYTAAQNEPAQRLFAGAGFRRTMIEMTLDR
jgi:ribosomal protein S18 acetylase RimI-like enzyme